MLSLRSIRILGIAAVVGISAWSPISAKPPWQLVAFRRVEADPTKKYELSEQAGPWLIFAASFAGDGAAEDVDAVDVVRVEEGEGHHRVVVVGTVPEAWEEVAVGFLIGGAGLDDLAQVAVAGPPPRRAVAVRHDDREYEDDEEQHDGDADCGFDAREPSAGFPHFSPPPCFPM